MKITTRLFKIIASTAILFAVYQPSRSQIVMYGLASSYGPGGMGTLFTVNSNGVLDTVTTFNGTFAAIPYGSPFYASDGNFYASSVDGGYADSCAIFRCTPNGVQTTMINLDSVWGGSDPQGNDLMQAQDGNLYGMTVMGGTYSNGVLYKLTLSGQYTALHFFDASASTPYGSLIQTADGNLWGMTSAGGTNGYGTVFKCTTSGVFTIMYSFAATDGERPFGALLQANDGNFYGLTSAGGQYGFGTIFQFTPSGSFTKIADFNGTNGKAPYGSLIQATDGYLYGLTSAGGFLDAMTPYGTLFKCSLSGNINSMHTFDRYEGATAMGTLLQASDGNMYGVTSAGGANSLGVVFKYTLSGTFTKIADFNTTLGGSPMYAKLIEPANNVLGINTVAVNNNVRIYPNPNNGSFTISDGKPSGETVVEIFNMLGEKVYSQVMGAQNSRLNINISGQPSGVYMYKVVSGQGDMLSTGKFIIE